MVIFNSYVSHYQRVSLILIFHIIHQKIKTLYPHHIIPNSWYESNHPLFIHIFSIIVDDVPL